MSRLHGFVHIFDTLKDNEGDTLVSTFYASSIGSEEELREHLANIAVKSTPFLSAKDASLDFTIINEEDEGTDFIANIRVPAAGESPAHCTNCTAPLPSYKRLMSSCIKACPYCNSIFMEVQRDQLPFDFAGREEYISFKLPIGSQLPEQRQEE